MIYKDRLYWLKPRNWIHRFRYKFSEAYRIEIGVGLSPIRNERELKALIKFCRNEIKDREHMKLNPARDELYKATIKLYEWQNDDHEVKMTVNKDNSIKITGVRYIKLKNEAFKGDGEFRLKKGYSILDDLIEDHIGWYWN